MQYKQHMSYPYNNQIRSSTLTNNYLNSKSSVINKIRVHWF
jgi:hypothetical protein